MKPIAPTHSTLLLALTLLLGLSACSTPKPSRPVKAPTAPAMSLRQDYLKPDDLRRVRTGEFVKTYHVGRSMAGRGGRTMHEAHRVYRLEKPSRWNLLRGQPPLASTGPVEHLVDTAFKPAPHSKAIQAELNRQRAISARLEAAEAELREAVGSARNKLGDSQRDAERLAALRREMERLRKEGAPAATVIDSGGAAPKPDPGVALRQWGASLEEDSGEAAP